MILTGGSKHDHPQIAEKVKLFFFEYARNRHKMTTITPAYHAVSCRLYTALGFQIAYAFLGIL